MIYNITVFFLLLLCKIYFKIKFQGKENIPKKGGFLLASNHVSYLDPPILASGCYFKRSLNFLAKIELFRNKLFAWYITKLNAISVRRRSSDIGAIKECIKRLRRGEGLVVFPEGERSEDGIIMEGFPGIALLAVRTKVPVIPAYIKDADKALDIKKKRLRFQKVYLKFGKPLYFDENDSKDYIAATNRIMEAIKELAREFE